MGCSISLLLQPLFKYFVWNAMPPKRPSRFSVFVSRESKGTVLSDSQYCLTKEKGFGKPQRTETCIFRSLGFYSILTLQIPYFARGSTEAMAPAKPVSGMVWSTTWPGPVTTVLNRPSPPRRTFLKPFTAWTSIRQVASIMAT